MRVTYSTAARTRGAPVHMPVYGRDGGGCGRGRPLAKGSGCMKPRKKFKFQMQAKVFGAVLLHVMHNPARMGNCIIVNVGPNW
jgi:hypothetical protein